MGDLIRFRGWVSLVAGYDPESDVPPEFAGRVVGDAVLRAGVGTGMVGAGVASGTASSLLWVLYVLGVLVETGRAVYRLNTYSATD